MSMNITITLPLEIIQSIQSAQTEAMKDPDIIKACTTAAVVAVEQLSYKLLPHHTTPKIVAPAPSTKNKRPRTDSDDDSSITITITFGGTGRRHQLQCFRSTRISSLHTFMQNETGVPASGLRIIFDGKQLAPDKTLGEVSVENINANS